jgi:hypothetical protein
VLAFANFIGLDMTALFVRQAVKFYCTTGTTQTVCVCVCVCVQTVIHCLFTISSLLQSMSLHSLMSVVILYTTSFNIYPRMYLLIPYDSHIIITLRMTSAFLTYWPLQCGTRVQCFGNLDDGLLSFLKQDNYHHAVCSESATSTTNPLH